MDKLYRFTEEEIILIIERLTDGCNCIPDANNCRWQENPSDKACTECYKDFFESKVVMKY